MKAIIIDPFKRCVYETEIDGDYKAIQATCDCRCFTAIMLDSKNVMYIDDEGLLTMHMRPTEFFKYEGYAQPLANRAVILGTTYDGDSANTTLLSNAVEKKISFMDYAEAMERLQDGGIYEQ